MYWTIDNINTIIWASPPTFFMPYPTHTRSMLIRFLLYGFMGWIGEILFTGTGSLLAGSLKLTGHTYLWMFPIYGLAVFLEPMHNRVRSMPWLVRGTIWAGLCFMIEYLTGWFLKLTIGVCPWDYSYASLYMLDGFIRLDYFPVWFATGMLFEKIHDFLCRLKIIYIPEGQGLVSRITQHLRVALKPGRMPDKWSKVIPESRQFPSSDKPPCQPRQL